MIQTSIVAPGGSPGRGRRLLASSRSTRSSAGYGIPCQGRLPKTPSIASSVGLMRLSRSQTSFGSRAGASRIDPHREPGVLRPDPGSGHCSPHGFLPRVFMSSSECGWTASYRDPHEVPVCHVLRVARPRSKDTRAAACERAWNGSAAWGGPHRRCHPFAAEH
jgi:hypothetical protein